MILVVLPFLFSALQVKSAVEDGVRKFLNSGRTVSTTICLRTVGGPQISETKVKEYRRGLLVPRESGPTILLDSDDRERDSSGLQVDLPEFLVCKGSKSKVSSIRVLLRLESTT